MIDSRYVCDNCLEEMERASREAARKREEAALASREAARRLSQEIALARELALAEARKNSKIRYLRIIFVLSLIMFIPAPFLLSQETPGGPPPIQTNPPLSIIVVLGGILLLTSWLCVIGFAIQRKQWNWVIGLFLLAGICWPLYLILDPLE